MECAILPDTVRLRADAIQATRLDDTLPADAATDRPFWLQWIVRVLCAQRKAVHGRDIQPN